jgi:hypothetical protein
LRLFSWSAGFIKPADQLNNPTNILKLGINVCGTRACIVYCSGDQLEKNEMGGACSIIGRGEAYTGFWWGNLRERDNVEYPGVDGRIILRWIFRKLDVGGHGLDRVGSG